MGLIFTALRPDLEQLHRVAHAFERSEAEADELDIGGCRTVAHRRRHDELLAGRAAEVTRAARLTLAPT